MIQQGVIAYIGLGSNQGRRRQQILAALRAVQRHPSLSVQRISSLYQTAPWGVEDQADFLNAVATVTARLQAPTLLAALKQVEQDLGRQADGPRWGPRPIDLDLLLFDDQHIQAPGLTVPHPRLHRRAFVLIPLLELHPDIRIPGVGPAAQALEMLDQTEKDGVVRYADAPELASLQTDG